MSTLTVQPTNKTLKNGLPQVDLMTSEHAEMLTSRVKPRTNYRSRPVGETEQRSPIQGTLDPYQGEWDYLQAAHLLRRTTIGPTKEQIEWAIENGPASTITALLADTPLPAPPINYGFDEDPFTPVGETWVDKPFQQEFQGYRFASLYAWTMGNMLEEELSIRETMTLFWHNHFVTAEINLPKAVYQYITLLRENALGNFRELTKLVTINPSMLAYLNGAQNTKFAPNENFARELCELFVLGKGEPAGPGDYTTFTEYDVQKISEILTGWRIRLIDDGSMPEPFFNNFFHTEGEKQLSHRFNKAVIEENGAQEYADLIDLLFQHPEASRFIVRKLYRWFVYYKIDETIEQNIIEPLAQILRDNDFNVEPVLETLLKSEHFYDANSIGCIIKNPIYFTLATTKQLNVPFPNDPFQRYALWNGIFRFTEFLQMVYYFPPSVAGWKAFHQEPSYNQLWINTVTLIIRQEFTDNIANAAYLVFGERWGVRALEFIATMDNPLNPNDLIRSIAQVIYPQPIEQEQIDQLKQVLIPGLPDEEWTIEYQMFLDNPNDPGIRLTVETKVRALLRAMLARPEYHLG